MQQQLDALRGQIQESMAKSNEVVRSELAQVTSQIHQQMDSVSHNMQSATGQIHTRLDSYSQMVQSVSGQLGSLSEATVRIFEATKNISALEDILRPPKLRGSMGELLLENVLREIFPAESFYSFQYKFKNGEAVDSVIHLKDGIIPIDAKFPLDNFRRMIESKEPEEQARLRKEFIRNVRKHIDDIAAKYILPDEGTVNFALMYIPAENVYYETIIRDQTAGDDLYALATKKHVFPVSPNSLYPYLMTIALGFRGLKIEEKAKEILGELNRLHGDLARFTDDFRKMGSHLSDAQKRFAEGEKRLDRIDSRLVLLREGSIGESVKPAESLPTPKQAGFTF